MKRLMRVLCILFCMAPAAGAAVATFDDLTLAPESCWNGSDGSGGFSSGDAYFANGFTDWGGGFTSWDGWAYSSMTDTTTPGYSNQFSVIAGGGANGSANYGVAYDGGQYGSASPPTTSFGAVTGEDYDTIISGAYFTNTTYAYLSMRDGDTMVNHFSAGDYQMLTIKGITDAGEYTASSVIFYLADFTNGNSYIVDEWTWVDLASLGQVVGLELSFSGSQSNMVPSYVAMDDLNGTAPVPVPAAVWLLGSGLLGLLGCGRRRRC
jgi:uncharacterized protein YuzE